MSKFSKFYESGNPFALLKIGSEVIGIGALERISDEIVELERLYITPHYRKMNLGREMLIY